MSEHVKTNIRNALIYQLKQITTANGYFNTVGQVFSNKIQRSAIVEYPSCVLVWGQTPVENPDSSGSRVDQSDGLAHKLASLVMVWYLNDQNDAALARERLLADVEKRIGLYPTIPSYTGAYTCLNSWVDFEEPTGSIYNEPAVGQVIGLKIRYRHLLTDPTSLD